MKLTLQRDQSAGGATIGKLYVNDAWACYTLEDEVREIPGEPVANWKIKGKTAIPSGEYAVTLEESPTFGPNTLTINDVPGFTGIRIHAGNTQEDTAGCVLVGMKVTHAAIVGGYSKQALEMVKSHVAAAIASDDTVTIAIINATELA